MMNDELNNSLADMEKRFYKTMSNNTFFSSFNRSASALEKLATNTEALTIEISNANKSSSKLAKSLNKLTFTAIIIASAALIFEILKWVSIK